MKISLVKILIIFSFLSCEINKDKIKKTWVGKYRVSHSNSEGKGISEIGLRNIIKFDNDSLLIKNFQLSLIDDNKEQVSLQYELVKNQILTSKDTFNIQNIFTDSLIISLNQGNSKKIVYEELSRYNQANREKELIQLLTSNTFTTQKDTIVIEFQKNGKYVSRSFNFGTGSNQNWMTDKFDNELFLVFDGFFGGAIQIQEIKSKQIIGKIYHKENIEVIWNRLEEENGFEVSQILSKWEKIENPTPPPLIKDKEKYYEKEILIIAEDEILRYEGFRVDTLNWELNRGKNIIILDNEEDLEIRNGKQWNIISIENDILTLERKERLLINPFSKIGLSKFKRKN